MDLKFDNSLYEQIRIVNENIRRLNKKIIKTIGRI